MQRCQLGVRFIAGLLACCVFSGCFPLVENYQRVEVADARYLQGLCGGSGPHDWTYYPFHGIFISVSLFPSMQLGLHYPVTSTATLESNVVIISGSRHNEPIKLAVQLRPALHAALGNSAPEEFDATADPMDPGGKHGYRRSSSGRGLVWANFITLDTNTTNRTVSLPADLERAVIVIPAMTINGQLYGPQELPITVKKYIGVTPVNC
jgi:hypothetical protein